MKKLKWEKQRVKNLFCFFSASAAANWCWHLFSIRLARSFRESSSNINKEINEILTKFYDMELVLCLPQEPKQNIRLRTQRPLEFLSEYIFML